MNLIFAKIKRRVYKHLWFFRPLVYLLAFLILIVFFVWTYPKTTPFFKNLWKGPQAAISLANPAIESLDKYQGRTNFLLLGSGGGDHPGADLTDSIMLISVDLLSGDTVLISLPRDIWVESLSSKLNAAYHFGEEKEAGGGLILAASAVSEIINQPIHYTIMLDFSGFTKAIDILGGVSVDVPHSFTDNQYPIPGKEEAPVEADRYQTLKFFSGEQVMDGATALKYVRSRHSEGEEGNDYARAQRQQLVILSLKDQLMSLKTLTNPSTIKQLRQALNDSIETNIPTAAYPDLLKLALRIDKSNIRTGIINQGSDSEDIPPLLYNPPANLYGQWVLLPINNSWQAIYAYVEEILYQNH